MGAVTGLTLNGMADWPGVSGTYVTAEPGTSLGEWEARFGDVFPLPAAGPGPGMARSFLARARAARVQDVAIADFRGVSAIWTSAAVNGIEDQVWMYVVRRGGWTIGGGRVLRAGEFLLQRGRLARCETAPGTTGRTIVMPAGMVGPLPGERGITGSANSAEARLLMAHADMVAATAAGLGPAGGQAARAAMVELAKGVARGRFDDTEPQLASVLAQAARDLADRMLADPELSVGLLARELCVSVRALQRAFTAEGEPATAYIRRRRLEEARLALSVPSGRLTVTQIAAHWGFADASHFTRAFKARYGCAPGEYIRLAGAAQGQVGEG